MRHIPRPAARRPATDEGEGIEGRPGQIRPPGRAAESETEAEGVRLRPGVGRVTRAEVEGAAMKRRGLCVAGFLMALLAAGPAPAAEPKRPNVLIILADDMGYSDAGCYGEIGRASCRERV